MNKLELINEIITLYDEVAVLREITRPKLTVSSTESTKVENTVEQKLVKWATKELTNRLISDYRKVDIENGIAYSFERWYESAFEKYNLPKNLSKEEVDQVIYENAYKIYEERKKTALNELTKKIKEETND